MSDEDDDLSRFNNICFIGFNITSMVFVCLKFNVFHVLTPTTKSFSQQEKCSYSFVAFARP